MPKDDDGGVPARGVPSRKQGRPPKDLSGLEGAQREFADVIRKEFFDRLAGLGVTTAQISAALGEGFSGPSLSKFRAGERVPDRDKLLRLLAYAQEVAKQPLPQDVREHVLEKYYAALRGANPQLHDFYRLMDEREQMVAERDTAREEQHRARDELVQCQESLGQVQRRVEQLEAEAKQAEREALRRQEREEAAENEIVQLQEQQDQWLRAVRGARAEQQAARKEIRRLQDLLVQQTQEAARSEAGLKDENAALTAEVSAAAARVAELEQTEQALRSKLEQVTAALERAEARSGELASEHAVVLDSRAVVSQRLSLARVQRRDLEDKQAALRQQVTTAIRQLTAAERAVADLESRLVAVYRSRDALLEEPAAPGQAVAEAVEAVDAAWQSYEVEISRIEQHAIVSPGGTTAALPAGTGEAAGGAVGDPAGTAGGDSESDSLPDQPSVAAEGTDGPPATLTAFTKRLRVPWSGLERDVQLQVKVLVAIFVLGVAMGTAGLLWGRDDGSQDKASRDDTKAAAEEDEPAEPVDEGPAPKWSSALPHPLDNQPVLDGTVVVTTAWRGGVYGVDASTGRRLWAVPTSVDDISKQPVVSEGLVHAYGFDELHTIDTRSGQVRWKKKHSFGSFAASPGSLVMNSDEEVTSLRPSDGKVLWSAELDGSSVGRAALTRDTVYISARSGEIYALDSKTGRVRWSKDVSKHGADRSPVAAGDAVIVDAGEEIVALDARSGKELWRKDYTIDSPDVAVTSGLLIFTATVKDGEAVTAVDLKTGAQKWADLNEKGHAQPLSLSAFADRVYVTYDSVKLCAHNIVDGALLDCFTNVNTLPGVTATADGVYANSYNQRLYYFQKGEFG
ncbi:PQQ-binding-like beta-propeller repeat protein [Streptomyces sp. NPDC013953]|uniref:outer membrane protein assembly factor BamB family protein n=1 Tax=Streptomyces sp. NPDC013953 TaxID=3364868 RepID=UPI0036FD2DF5